MLRMPTRAVHHPHLMPSSASQQMHPNPPPPFLPPPPSLPLPASPASGASCAAGSPGRSGGGGTPSGDSGRSGDGDTWANMVSEMRWAAHERMWANVGVHALTFSSSTPRVSTIFGDWPSSVIGDGQVVLRLVLVVLVIDKEIDMHSFVAHLHMQGEQ